MRLATFNILHGRDRVEERVDLGRFRDAIAALDADVLALQEVDRDQPRSQRADLTALAAEAMGAVAHRFVAAVIGTPGGDWITATGDEPAGGPQYGVALLSRYPARDWQTVRLPRAPLRIPLYAPGHGLLVLKEEPRVAVAARLDTPLGELSVASTHLSFVPGWNRGQLRRVQRELAARHDRLILMGDLNMAPPAPTRVTGYASLAAHVTFPAHAPTRQIDHVLAHGVTPTVTATRAVDLAISDHQALVVDISDLHAG